MGRLCVAQPFRQRGLGRTLLAHTLQSAREAFPGQPIRIGDLVVVTADIVYVGHSSMEIAVNVIVEDLDEDSDAQLALSAYFTMVALDRNARPKSVPPLALDTEEARIAFEEGKRRYAAHKARKRGAANPAGGCVCAILRSKSKAAEE